MSKTKESQIKELLVKLEKANDKKEKQYIRKELRSLGHKGGLGKGRGKKVKTVKAVKTNKSKAGKTPATTTEAKQQ